MSIHVEHDTPVPPEKVQAYFFDLREDDHQRGNHPKIVSWKEGDYRKILSRGDREVRAEDGYRGGKVKVGFVFRKDAANAIDNDVHGNWYDSKGRLAAQPKATGSHIVFHSDATWKPGTWLPKLFMKTMLEKAIREDMKEHMRIMDEDWAKQPW